MAPAGKAKVINPNQPVEELAYIFIQRIAHKMHALWRRTPNDDYGFDGELELTHDGEVTGFIIKVQLKSGHSYFRNRTPSSFDFYADAKDVSYWEKTNVPAILVVYDPEKDRGYWVDVKGYRVVDQNFETSRTIHFSLRKSDMSGETLLPLSELVIPDEAERTDFLVDQIQEDLHSNLLPLIAVPASVWEADLSVKRLADACEEDRKLGKALQGKYRAFQKPDDGGWYSLRACIDHSTLKEIRYPDYLRRAGTRNFAVGRWNQAVRDLLLERGLLAKDADTYYFPPNPDGSARSLTWTSMRGRAPERQVAYPYVGKKSGEVAFWVHHACRVAICEVGARYYLRLVPAYVFTRNGTDLLADREAGALGTSRKSKDRNYQVLNHLMFWLWFLQEGKGEIEIKVDGTSIILGTTFLCGHARFGIPADKKSLIDVVNAEHEVDWEELEEESEGIPGEASE